MFKEIKRANKQLNLGYSLSLSKGEKYHVTSTFGEKLQ
jgi:hypothetical protein